MTSAISSCGHGPKSVILATVTMNGAPFCHQVLANFNPTSSPAKAWPLHSGEWASIGEKTFQHGLRRGRDIRSLVPSMSMVNGHGPAHAHNVGNEEIVFSLARRILLHGARSAARDDRRRVAYRVRTVRCLDTAGQAIPTLPCLDTAGQAISATCEH